MAEMKEENIGDSAENSAPDASSSEINTEIDSKDEKTIVEEDDTAKSALSGEDVTADVKNKSDLNKIADEMTEVQKSTDVKEQSVKDQELDDLLESMWQRSRGYLAKSFIGIIIKINYIYVCDNNVYVWMFHFIFDSWVNSVYICHNLT